MLNLSEVEEAKAVMKEAVNWSVMRWLAEKKRVRKAADVANAALDTLEKRVKDCWSDELKAAYDELAEAGGTRQNGKKRMDLSPEIKHLAKSLREAHEEAYRARMDAEDTFDVAERRLSTSMAREGTRKAITSWELFEKVIVKFQEALNADRAAQ